jgi:hypothetical protein
MVIHFPPFSFAKIRVFGDAAVSGLGVGSNRWHQVFHHRPEESIGAMLGVPQFQGISVI